MKSAPRSALGKRMEAAQQLVRHFFLCDLVFVTEHLRLEHVPAGFRLRPADSVRGRRLRQEVDVGHNNLCAVTALPRLPILPGAGAEGALDIDPRTLPD